MQRGRVSHWIQGGLYGFGALEELHSAFELRGKTEALVRKGEVVDHQKNHPATGHWLHNFSLRGSSRQTLQVLFQGIQVVLPKLPMWLLSRNLLLFSRDLPWSPLAKDEVDCWESARRTKEETISHHMGL